MRVGCKHAHAAAAYVPAGTSALVKTVHQFLTRPEARNAQVHKLVCVAPPQRAQVSSSNCLTLLGDGSDPAATLGMHHENNPSAPTCAQVMYDRQTLSPFCCDEMDLPNCPTAAVESMGSPPVLISAGQGYVVSDRTAACTQ